MQPDETRFFTVDEANALLPRLERDLARIHALYRTAKDRYIEIKQLNAVGRKDDGTPIMAYDLKAQRREFERLVRSINAIIGEINALGCQVKHLETGLIDFPARIRGERVFLCWKLGEPAVAFYHRPEDGYAGRRPIPETFSLRPRGES